MSSFVRFSAACMIAFTLVMVHDTSFADMSFYVSLTGNDSWSGKLTEPNDAKTDGPFATGLCAGNEVRFDNYVTRGT